MLRSPIFDFEPTQDLELLKSHRITGWKLYKEILPVQPPETRAGLTQADVDAQIDDADAYPTPNWSLHDLIYIKARDTGKTIEEVEQDRERSNAEADARIKRWFAEYDRQQRAEGGRE